MRAHTLCLSTEVQLHQYRHLRLFQPSSSSVWWKTDRTQTQRLPLPLPRTMLQVVGKYTPSWWTRGYLFCLDLSLGSHNSLNDFCHGGGALLSAYDPATSLHSCRRILLTLLSLHAHLPGAFTWPQYPQLLWPNTHLGQHTLL